jgi:hypothetical protein
VAIPSTGGQRGACDFGIESSSLTFIQLPTLTEGYLYDLVDFGRQVLVNIFVDLSQFVDASFTTKSLTALQA